MLGFLFPRESVYRQELADWAADLRTLSVEGKYFFSTTRCFFGVTKPTTAVSGLEQAEDVHTPL
jgi:hypothetical protein